MIYYKFQPVSRKINTGSSTLARLGKPVLKTPRPTIKKGGNVRTIEEIFNFLC